MWQTVVNRIRGQVVKNLVQFLEIESDVEFVKGQVGFGELSFYAANECRGHVTTHFLNGVGMVFTGMDVASVMILASNKVDQGIAHMKQRGAKKII